MTIEGSTSLILIDDWVLESSNFFHCVDKKNDTCHNCALTGLAMILAHAIVP